MESKKPVLQAYLFEIYYDLLMDPSKNVSKGAGPERSIGGVFTPTTKESQARATKKPASTCKLSVFVEQISQQLDLIQRPGRLGTIAHQSHQAAKRQMHADSHQIKCAWLSVLSLGHSRDAGQHIHFDQRNPEIERNSAPTPYYYMYMYVASGHPHELCEH